VSWDTFFSLQRFPQLMPSGFPFLFLHQWVISPSTFCLHSPGADGFSGMLHTKEICWIKATLKYFLFVDFFKDFPTLFFFFSSLSYCNVSSHLQISFICRLHSFSIDGHAKERCFQIDFFPLSAVEREMPAGEQEVCM